MSGMLSAVLLFFAAAPAGAPASRPAGPTVRLIAFVSRGCAACETVEPWRLRRLGRKLGVTVQPRYYPLDEPANVELLEAYERYLGRGEPTVPVVIIGREVLRGPGEVEDRLEEVVRVAAVAGGVDWTELPPEYRPGATTRSAAAKSRKAIYLAYFYRPGCRECRRVTHVLRYLRRRYPNVVVREFDASEPASRRLLWAMGVKAGVPPERRLASAVVFVDRRPFIGGEATLAALEEAVANPSWEQIPPPWEVSETDLQLAEAGIEYQFRKMDVWTVAAAALADGVNPCAFATILFLVAYLTAVGRSRREALFCGAAFTAGVLVTYFALGLALRALLAAAAALEGVAPWIYRGTGILCILLAAGSAADYFRARRKGLKEMRLVMPRRWRTFTRSLIARGLRARYLVPASLLLGAAVSLVELVCTGQVYLPTILHVIRTSARVPARAYWLLALYNVVFILPLAAVFTLVALGVSSRRLAAFSERHLAKTKLALAAVFLVLGGGLLYFSLA